MLVRISLLCLVVLLSCSRNQQEQSGTLVKGGKRSGGTYRINMVRGNPNGLDPVTINSKLADDIALQIFDRLLTLDSNLRIQPELATRWEVLNGGTLYRFRLRDSVFFHDNQCFPNAKGRKLIASDVVYSLNRCADPRLRTVHFWAFQGKVRGAQEYFNARLSGGPVRAIEGIRAIGDTLVEIELLKPYAPFIYVLTNSTGCVVPHEAVSFYGENFTRNPVGSGAFQFAEWKDDQYIGLVRNPRYWQKDEHGNRLPFLDGVRISLVKDDKLQFTEFERGGLEESFTIPTEFFENVVDPQSKKLTDRYKHFQFQSRPAMLTWFLDFLCSEPPFDKKEVRQAFSHAIDRERLVKFVLKNSPYLAGSNGITPPVLPGYDIWDIRGYSYNPVLARQLLAKAGYKNGEGLPKITLHVYTEPRLVQVAEAVQKMLHDALNVHISIQVMQFAELLTKAENGELQFWGTRWYGDYPDPENYLNLLDGVHVPPDKTLPSYPNSSRYKNPIVSALLEQAVQSGDAVERASLYRRAEQTAIDDSPIAVLFYEMHYRLLQPYVRGYPLDAQNRVVLKHVWLDR